MSVEPGVIDANVLDYAVNGDASQHPASRSLLEVARDPSTALYVTSQILCEFYSIVTNARRFPKACSAPEALRIISARLVLPGLHVLPAPTHVVAGWMQLLQRHPVTGAGYNVDHPQDGESLTANPRLTAFGGSQFRLS